MSDLWADQRQSRRDAVQPLAARMRPRSLDEFAGQQHIVGPDMLLRRMLQADRLTSVIFWGPPGTGKTALAEVIANHTGRYFERANAALVGVKDIRRVMADAARRVEEDGRRTILFLDEIHRFSRSQQDVLLNDVEQGMITLIGATTENPYFAVNSALVSRSTLFRFEPLTEDDIALVLRNAMKSVRGYGGRDIVVDDDAIEVWARLSDGDARRALTALEVAVESATIDAGSAHPLAPGSAGGSGEVTQGDRVQGRLHDIRDDPPPEVGAKGQSACATPLAPGSAGGSGDVARVDRAHGRPNDSQTYPPPEVGANGGTIHITRTDAEQSIQQKAIVYDGTGDEHYDVVSALIKSMRGSDPDAAIYWLARMLEAGEDTRFIARRIAILASEDIGLADPNALNVAASAWTITERVGMPECQLTLAEAVIYMCLAPKSNASAKAIWSAMSEVKEGRTIPVPRHLRDAHYGGAKNLGHGEGYRYPHKEQSGYSDQQYLGVDRTYYKPTAHGSEGELARRLEALRAAIRKENVETSAP